MADWNKYWTGLKKGFHWTWHFVFDDFKRQAGNAMWAGILAFFLLGLWQQLYRMAAYAAGVSVLFFLLYKVAKLMKG